jgi:methionine-gamma-lyase
MRRHRDDSIDGIRLHPASLMMGYGYNPEWSEGSIKSPIFQTSTFVFRTAEEGKAYFELAYGLREPEPGEQPGLIYSRLNNPDLEILEDRLSLWDGAETAATFSSGMAAIATTMLSYLRPGMAVLHSEPLYGGTDHIVNHVLPAFDVTPVPFQAWTSRDEIDRRIAATGRPLGLVMIETPANPTNALFDIAAVAAVARAHRTDERPCPLVVDNTFLGPLWQRPLDHGADLVVYSATKFIGGHSDLIAGACLGSHAMADPVRAMRTFLGTMTDPWVGWLMLRSLETLELRMTRQAETARTIADFLADHPKVRNLHYLGLLTPDDPQHDVFKRQCLGPGSMISFEIEGGQPAAFRFLNTLELAKLAVSLGGTETLVEHPASMTHAGCDPTERELVGVTDGLVRMSVGVEHAEDLLLDIRRALDAA